MSFLSVVLHQDIIFNTNIFTLKLIINNYSFILLSVCYIRTFNSCVSYKYKSDCFIKVTYYCIQGQIQGLTKGVILVLCILNVSFVVIIVLCMYALCGVLLYVCVSLSRRKGHSQLVEFKSPG